MQQVQSRDEAEVLESVQRLRDALEQLDAKRFAACFAMDADFNTPVGTTLRGRKEIHEVHEKIFSPHPTPGSPSFARAKSTNRVVNVRFLRADVAVVDWEWTQSGATLDGKAWPDRQGLLTMVWTREADGTWLISVWRNKDYAQHLQSFLPARVSDTLKDTLKATP